MGRRQRRRARETEAVAPAPNGGQSAYTDAEGSVLVLRDRLSAGTLSKLGSLRAAPAATADDLWQRREELLFERLTVSWEIAGLPLTGQRELLGRYRMADHDTRRWVRQTITEHLRRVQPEAGF